MNKTTFVFLRGCSPRFSAPGQPPGRHRWRVLIRSGTAVLGKPIQDDSSSESNFIEATISAERTAILFAIAMVVAMPLCPRLLADNDHNPIGVTGAFEGVITTGGAYNVLNHTPTGKHPPKAMPLLLQTWLRFSCQHPPICRRDITSPAQPELTYERMKIHEDISV
jgi:hypothetical protein